MHSKEQTNFLFNLVLFSSHHPQFFCVIFKMKKQQKQKHMICLIQLVKTFYHMTDNMEISIQKQVYYQYKTDLNTSINNSGCTFSLKGSEDAPLSRGRTSLVIWPLMYYPRVLQKLLNLGLFILLGMDTQVYTGDEKKIHLSSSPSYSFFPAPKDQNQAYFLDQLQDQAQNSLAKHTPIQ